MSSASDGDASDGEVASARRGRPRGPQKGATTKIGMRSGHERTRHRPRLADAARWIWTRFWTRFWTRSYALRTAGFFYDLSASGEAVSDPYKPRFSHPILRILGVGSGFFMTFRRGGVRSVQTPIFASDSAKKWHIAALNSRFCQGGIFLLQLFFYCWTIAVVYTARAAARRPYNARAPAKPARECVKSLQLFFIAGRLRWCTPPAASKSASLCQFFAR